MIDLTSDYHAIAFDSCYHEKTSKASPAPSWSTYESQSQRSSWEKFYLLQECREIWELAKQVYDFYREDPGSRIFAITCTLKPSVFGDWETVNSLRPSKRRETCHQMLWKACYQFFSRVTRKHVNHPEKHTEKWPYLLAFIDDPVAKYGCHNDTFRLPHLHSILIVRSCLAQRVPYVDLRKIVSECWSKSPFAHDIDIQPIGNCLEKIAGWIAYSAKYAWWLRRLNTEEHQWDCFGGMSTKT